MVLMWSVVPPGGLFQRLLTRVIRWSLERGGHEPLLSYHQARCFLNAEHDLALQMAPLHMARIKVKRMMTNILHTL